MKVDSSRLWTQCARIKVSRGKTMSDTLIRDNKDYGSMAVETTS